MKLWKIVVYLAPAILLLGFLGWYPFIQAAPKKVEVAIFDNCVTATRSACDPKDSQTACAVIKDTIAWKSLDPHHEYSANFATRTPFTSNLIDAGPQGQTVIGDSNCKQPSSAVDPNCYFSYEVYRYDEGHQNGAKCSDPGVRVVPPTLYSLLVWLELRLGFRAG